MGVFVTRPAFTKIMERIVGKMEDHEAHVHAQHEEKQ